LESLEDRTLPAILFTPAFGPEQPVHQLNQPVLGNNPPVFLIFWGTEWSAGNGVPNQAAIDFEKAALSVFPGPYLSALAQYDGSLGNAVIAGSVVVDTSEPADGFTVDQLLNVVGSTDSLGIPEVDDFNGVTPLYVVLTPSGKHSDQGNGIVGYHLTGDVGGWPDSDASPVAWVGTNLGVDEATVELSRVVVGATTNPDPSPGNGTWGVLPGPTWPGPVGFEFDDNEAVNFRYRLNNTLVQSYWSNKDQAYIVPDGNFQTFVVTAGTLIVNGDQLANKVDTIVIDLSPQGGVHVHLNSEDVTFEPGAIQSITVNTLTGTNAVTVGATAANVPVTINAGGNDFVSIGNAGNMKDVNGDVNLSNPAHLTTLTVDNSKDLVGQKHVTINTAQIAGFTNAHINYNGLQLASLTVKGGRGVNTYDVQSTPGTLQSERGVPVTLNLGLITSTSPGVPGGQNTVNVGANHTLDGIQGQLSINGQFGTTDSLNINDQGANAGHSYVYSGAMLTRSGAKPIAFNGVEDIHVNAGGFGDSFTLTTTPAAGTLLTLVGNGDVNSLTGPDMVNNWLLKGLNAGVLDGNVTFSGMANLTGGSQADTFWFVGTTTGVTGTIDGGGGTGNSLDYQLNGGAAVTVSLTSVSSGKASDIKLGFSNIDSLVGSTAADTLIGPNGNPNDWSITGNSMGSLEVFPLLATFSFQKVEHLVGGSGVDTFLFSVGASVLSIDGGTAGGGDWLDYSQFGNNPVTVNLTTGQATAVLAGVTNIQNVLGGAGNDTLTGGALGSVLIGGDGNDILTGAGGGNLLIGGKGSDKVTAGPGGDILIGGWTDYDSSSDINRWLLGAIMDEWRSGKLYVTRVGDLTNAAGWKLNGTTVHDDGVFDLLTGGAGQDWYFRQFGSVDMINGLSVGELVYPF
jgi:hypothetical protein